MDSFCQLVHTIYMARESEYSKNRDMLKANNPWVCGLCGHRIKKVDLTVDHIVPLSRGGSHDISNLRLVHAKCNVIKGNDLDNEMAIHKRLYFFWMNFLTIFIP